MTNKTSQLLFAALLLACATFAHSQVPVAIAPDIYPVYFGSVGPSAGTPLASGFLYTYLAGTTTQANTYIDSTGTVQNPFPIPLDATGAPTNGSAQTQIWLANQSYKFCAYSAAMVQQWCRDNIVSYLGLLNLANSWTLQNTFTLPIIDLATTNQIVFGSPGTQTTFDFPPPIANVVLHMPNTNDTMVGRNTTDTLTGKNLTSPTISNPATTGTDSGIETLANKTFTAPAINNPNLNGETVSNPGRYFISCYKQAAAGGGGTTSDCFFIPDKPITITHVIFGNTLTASVGCTTLPHFGVFISGGATVADTGPLANGAFFVDSGPLVSNLSAGISYAIGETGNDGGCGTHAGPGNITVEYKMQ